MNIINMFENSSPLAKLIIIDFSIQWSGFLIGVLFKTEKLYDLIGSLTFLLLSYLNYNWCSTDHPRQVIQSFCTSLWALRLGFFLFVRIMKVGKDRRFDAIKANPARFFSAWTLQGVWVFITLLPTLLAVKNPKQKILSSRDFIGWGLWIFGFGIEIIADYQKSVFRNQPKNKDKFINSGLWSVCRHPNYFGEIILWFGLYISASSCFKSWEYFTVLCPVFDYILISFISGIPPLESYGLKKWGQLPQYQEYIKNTPSLIPFWWP